MTTPALQNDKLNFANFDVLDPVEKTAFPRESRGFSAPDFFLEQKAAFPTDWDSKKYDSEDDTSNAFRKSALSSFIKPPKCKVSTDDVDWFSEAESDAESSTAGSTRKRRKSKKDKKSKSGKSEKEKSKSEKSKKDRSKDKKDKKDKKEKKDKKDRKEKRDRKDRKDKKERKEKREKAMESTGSCSGTWKDPRNEKPKEGESVLGGCECFDTKDAAVDPPTPFSGSSSFVVEQFFPLQTTKLLGESPGDDTPDETQERSQRKERSTAGELKSSHRRSHTPSRRGRRSVEKLDLKSLKLSKDQTESVFGSDDSQPNESITSSLESHLPPSIGSVVSDILATHDDDIGSVIDNKANSATKPSEAPMFQEELLEKAKEQARKRILDQSRKGPLRVRVAIRKKNGSDTHPNRSRRGSRTCMMPIVASNFEDLAGNDSFASMNSSSSSLRMLASLDDNAFEEHSSAPVTPRRKSRRVLDVGFNPNNVDVWAASPKAADEKSPRGRDVLHREDRLRPDSELTGVVEKVIRNRREQSVDARNPDNEGKEKRNSFVRKKSFGKLFGGSSHKSKKEKEPTGSESKSPRRKASGFSSLA